jgi:hypothetical protein
MKERRRLNEWSDMYLSPVRKGTIGEMQVAIDLLSKGWQVFQPCVDDFGIDLLVYSHGVANTIQVRAHTTRQCKSSFTTTINPCPAKMIAIPWGSNVFYVKNKKTNAKWYINISLNKPLNNQKKGIHWWEDYLKYTHPEE